MIFNFKLIECYNGMSMYKLKKEIVPTTRMIIKKKKYKNTN